MKTPLRIVVCGSAGRMGSRVCALAADDARFAVAARIQRGSRPAALAEALEGADALIDFSVPSASARAARAAAAAKVPLVVGTTGLSASQRQALRRASRRIPVFHSPNFSPGMSVLFHLARRAAKSLAGFDACISETHHKAKRDAPSGTALRLSAVVEAGSGRGPQIASLRAGDVVGEHTLTLAGPHERLELTHRAHSRDVFARGALEAALWVAGRRPGSYDMTDLLGLS